MQWAIGIHLNCEVSFGTQDPSRYNLQNMLQIYLPSLCVCVDNNYKHVRSILVAVGEFRKKLCA